ncbi:hypothetical protein EG68_02477 [Paragonimus skrjabini miyazakii]|uniref:Uncharacterized protein n=1 Tax=Paragonimus skrjabini miyazakii TaxID=59628 RepID=A0A8S9YFQ0_9TREM|nr:hypothetical protein EG68_02477 [Paragonimus skrjabini miyazakii]
MQMDETDSGLNMCDFPISKSLIDERHSFDNDLVLAAELGKALLERNNLLEQTLEKYRYDEQEKDLELELLRRQISELRDLSQKRSALVDEADGYNQELDRLNRRLLLEMAADKKEIKRLRSNVANLEEQLVDLLEQLSECTCERNFRVERRPCSYFSQPEGRLSRSASSSPVFRAPLSTRCFPSSIFRNRNAVDKGLFIDDELADQPQLSTCSTGPLVDRLHEVLRNTNYSSQPLSTLRPLPRFTRSSSWPPILHMTCSPNEPIVVDGIAADPKSPHDYTHPPGLHRPRATNAMSKNQTTGIRTLNTTNLRSSPCSAAATLSVPTSYDTSVGHNSTMTCTKEDIKTLEDMLDDAAFFKRLEAIYNMKVRCQVSNDYQPRYKQLFKDAFQLVRSSKLMKEESTHRKKPQSTCAEPFR